MPQSSIPGGWQGVSWLIPSTFGVRGYLRIASMGATIDDILPEVRALWIQAAVYFVTTCFVYKFQIINARKHAISHYQMIQDRIKTAREKNLRVNDRVGVKTFGCNTLCRRVVKVLLGYDVIIEVTPIKSLIKADEILNMMIRNVKIFQ